MLSYRHGYHAGNAGDVLKHLVLTALLRAARRKSTPLCYVETHAGAGEYDLAHDFAVRRREHDSGIGALWQARGAPLPALAGDYLAAVAALNDGDVLRRVRKRQPVDVLAVERCCRRANGARWC